MKFSIFTEGGRKFGYGHVVRCLAIAEALNELGCVVDFFINGEIDVKSFMPNFKCNLGPWVENPNKDLGDFFIFDSYHASMNQMQQISVGRKVLFIDDYQRFEYPEDSWILNACPGISSEIYPNNDNALLGTKYLPLRKEFWDISSGNKREFNNIEKILVMFGGSDINNLAPKTIWLLLELFTDAEIISVQGKSSRSLFELNNLANIEDRVKILVEPKINELIDCMCEADLAISAAGQTLQELACVGLPTIAIQVADNQSSNIKGWSDSGVLVPIMSHDSEHFKRKLINALETVSSSEIRRKLSYKAKQFVDGQGARRLVKRLLQNT